MPAEVTLPHWPNLEIHLLIEFFLFPFFYLCLCVYTQPRGSTFPMLEGPDSQETEEDKECVITPSTSVKFNAALQERNRINFMRNYLLLIGNTFVHVSQCKNKNG